MALTGLDFDRDAIAALCRRHRIRRLAVFGSALLDDARARDLDVLVEFEPDAQVGLRFITIQDELSEIFHRPVDLSTPGFLSRHFRDRVVAEAVPLYEAA